MPRRCASRFIRSAKDSSLPASASASTIDASLPDCTIIPRSNSDTVAGRAGSTNILEPMALNAFWETIGR
jgi:hypothetical protein